MGKPIYVLVGKPVVRVWDQYSKFTTKIICGAVLVIYISHNTVQLMDSSTDGAFWVELLLS